jgi:alpha-glucuronidase
MVGELKVQPLTQIHSLSDLLAYWLISTTFKRIRIQTAITTAILSVGSNRPGPIFERFAITPFWSICFAAPTVFSNITADPLNEATQQWWHAKANELYRQLPSLGGFLVKADSEGNTGPMQFNRTEADGANMLARALAPHGGTLIWRAFVYGAPHEPGTAGSEDLARQSFDTFKPLDGKFDRNVILQVLLLLVY